jgi:hypothetical protein
LLSDEDCRKIISVITIAERQLEDILKRKKWFYLNKSIK